MNQAPLIEAAEIGNYLTKLREQAGIKQSELARSIRLSPAVLSRIEAGERLVTEDELQNILAAIGTDEAKKLAKVLQREWLILPRPPLDHPDQDLLWEAEQVVRELDVLREQPDIRHAFERRLSEFVSELEQSAARVLKREYQIAFIGSIGIGKSTAICRSLGLEVPNPDGESSLPVFEVGGGGITICDVHLRTGPEYGILIEPRNDDEIRTDVADFAEHIMKTDGSIPDEDQPVSGTSDGISKEIERAIRNMAGFKIRREKGPEGKTIRRDEAKELGQEIVSIREFVADILSRMELHKRDRRDAWYESSCGKHPFVWLKEMFELVNNGRHPEFTLPKRIEVIIPEPVLGRTGAAGSNINPHYLATSDLQIRVVDTKGIDNTGIRADLESYLDERHTLTILCSAFNDAPSVAPQLLLQRALEAGVRSLSTHSALLVLARPEEALAVKDEGGIRVESVEEGYELKGEQVSMALEPLGLQNLAVGFFNARQDSPEQLREFMEKRIMGMREKFRDHLTNTTATARKLLLNHEQEQTQEVIRFATGTLRSWAEKATTLPGSGSHVFESLIMQMRSAHVSTIRASIRREGEWPNLSYSHHLGYGARRMAALSLGKKVDDLAVVCETLVGDPHYDGAQDLLNQAARVLSAAYEDLLRKVQLMGQTAFSEDLATDEEFWGDCRREWGRGPGYRDRIIKHNKDWFETDEHQAIENELWDLIAREWKQALSRMTALLENEL